MKPKHDVAGRCGKRCVVMFALLTVALALSAPTVRAQMDTSSHSESQTTAKQSKTFYLTNAGGRHFMEVQTVLRNALSRARVYGVPTQNAITVLGTPDDLALAQKIISETDRPQRAYRITYTITDMNNGARGGARHVSLVVVSGEKTQVKQGNRVPITTGTDTAGSTATQMQYLDVGINIEASVDGPPDHLRLHTRFEQSSVAEGKSGVGAQDPVIHQTTLDGDSNLEQGKAVVLGSLDVPGGGGHEEISVRSELAP